MFKASVLQLIPALFLLSGMSVTFAGCGLLIGNIKPVDEKSEEYGVVDLSKENPGTWSKLDAAQSGADQRTGQETTTEVSDVAFQAKSSPSIIALNSACRPTVEAQDSGLPELTRELLLGISDTTQRVEKELTVQSTPALETTLQGTMNGKPISVRSVVLRRKACVYDLLYMAPPERFTDHEADFSHFVASLRLK